MSPTCWSKFSWLLFPSMTAHVAIPLVTRFAATKPVRKPRAKKVEPVAEAEPAKPRPKKAQPAAATPTRKPRTTKSKAAAE